MYDGFNSVEILLLKSLLLSSPFAVMFTHAVCTEDVIHIHSTIELRKLPPPPCSDKCDDLLCQKSDDFLFHVTVHALLRVTY